MGGNGHGTGPLPPGMADLPPDVTLPPVRPSVAPPAEETAGRLIVAIPSVGRPGILAGTVRAMAAQERLPDLVLLSLSKLEDLGDLTPDALPFPVELLLGRKGATLQRNRVLDVARGGDVVLFLDDDFLMAPDYLRRTERLFEAHPDVVVATGTVLADGILGPGLEPEAGRRLVETCTPAADEDALRPAYAGYGCNMAVRMAPVAAHALRFDERLPLYSWLEDVDFSRRLAPYGRIVKSPAMQGVHLGTKTGRTPGLCLGYSQIANPVYLVRKGTMTRRHAAEMMLRNSASNVLRSLRPPPWADYRGRLRGNLLALFDVVMGRDSPGRILDFTS